MNYLKEKTSPLEKCIQDLEQSIIALLVKRLKEISEAEPDNIKSLLKLQNVNGDLQTIEKCMETAITKGAAEICDIVEESAREYYEAAEEKYDGEIISYKENEKVLDLVEKVKKECIEKITQDLKPNKIGFENSEGEFECVEKAYRSIINEAVKKAAKYENIDDFIEMIIERLAETGLLKI